MSIIFNQIFKVCLVDWNFIAFFQSLGNTPSFSIDRNISFTGITIVLQYGLIILISFSLHP